MPALVIPIHDLDSHGKDYVFALDASWLGQAFGQTDVRGDTSRAGSAEVHAQRNGNEILVHGRAHAWLLTECVRCLQELPVEVSCDLAALYAPGSGAKHKADSDEDDDLDPSEPDREFYSGDQVAIDDLVRDYLLLELPMQPRCEEAGRDCPSLALLEQLHEEVAQQVAPLSGEDTIDPRLLPLMKLAHREPDKE